MASWQLVLVILTAVLVGAVIPVALGLSIVLYRAAREITALGKRLTPALEQTRTVLDRVEMLSRGLKGGEKDVADLLGAIGVLSRGLERNAKIFDISSAVLAAVGPAVAAFVTTMGKSNDSEALLKQHNQAIPGPAQSWVSPPVQRSSEKEDRNDAQTS
jgi:hypothetical protein